jgi:hypothetical protein
MRVAILFFISVSAIAGAKAWGAEPQQSEDCEGLNEVLYRTPQSVPIKDRVIISLTKEQLAKSVANSKNEKSSEQGTVRLVFLEQPDFTKNGPWSTKVLILGNEARPIGITIEIREHGNSPVRCEWLNEKLLFVRVWWGRVVSTDLILDIETLKPIYLEEADYYRLILPCDQKRELQKGGRPN